MNSAYSLRLLANKSSGYAVVSFDMIATLLIPSASKSLQSRTNFRRIALTYGQWLQINMTSSSFPPLHSFSVQRRISTPVKSKSGAFLLNSHNGVSSFTILLSKCGENRSIAGNTGKQCQHFSSFFARITLRSFGPPSTLYS